MLNFFAALENKQLSSVLFNGLFGLEKESIRVDINGNVALSDHPHILGDKSINPFITTDFAEAQIELITRPLPSITETVEFISVLHDIVSICLGDEYLWPYSMPPKLPQQIDTIKIANFTDSSTTGYRKFLAQKYGIKKQLISGVHFNFSFSQELIMSLYKNHDKSSSLLEFKNAIYMKVARNYFKYSWLVIYLFGASSVIHKSYFDQDCEQKSDNAADSILCTDGNSYRNGVNGYRNIDKFFVSYNSLNEYITDIQNAINNKQIIQAQEYYSQVRLKTKTKKDILYNLATTGIEYIEIRTLDINPYLRVGVCQQQLEFIHLLLVYCLLVPDSNMSNTDYFNAQNNQILASDSSIFEPIYLINELGEKEDIVKMSNDLINNMHELFFKLESPKKKLDLIQKIKTNLNNKNNCIAKKIIQDVQAEGYNNFFLNAAKTSKGSSYALYPSFPHNSNSKVNAFFNEIMATLQF
jgi:glutamate--cysteine ligase